jgi:hypothetical protein
MGKSLTPAKIRQRIQNISDATDLDVRRNLIRSLYRFALESIRRNGSDALTLSMLALKADEFDPDLDR